MRPKAINMEALRKVYASDRCGHALLNHSVRPHCQFTGRESTVEQLQNMLTSENLPRIGRRELIRTLHVLDRIGCGKLVLGRRGLSTRMVWSQAPPDIGLQVVKPAASGTTPAPASRTSAPASNKAEAKPAGILEANGACVHPFRLRRSFTVFLELPADLTRGETERLAAFVRSLALETEG